MRLTVSTWNINSVRLRINLIARFLRAAQPDVLCLQETKCPDDKFPLKRFKRMGYTHFALNGQKGYHGVAIVSRLPFDGIDIRGFCGKTDCRHIAVKIGAQAGFATATTLHNFYVPAGGDEPDPDINEKFAHKLAFLDEMRSAAGMHPDAGGQAILVGDLNVAPLEHDVWSHKQLLRVVSWWSYRAADWQAVDRGRRLDHIWVSPAIAGRVSNMAIAKQARGWSQPSDHVPVTATLEL
jgi:exodeoxyribonuclease-3